LILTQNLFFQIFLFKIIYRLKLDGNQLTRIPFEINYLSNLQYLNLKSNSLKEFPEAVSLILIFIKNKIIHIKNNNSI